MTYPLTSATLSSCASAVAGSHRSQRAGRPYLSGEATSAAVSNRRGTSCHAQQRPAFEAFEEMIVTSRQKFVAVAYKILRNREDAEDAIQNASLSAFHNLRNFEGRSALTTWFTRIVVNAALMIQRKRKANWIDLHIESDAEEDTSRMERVPDPQPDPEVVCSGKESFGLVQDELEKMPPALQQALAMTYYDEMSSREACSLLGVSVGTFKSRLFRAKRQLWNRTDRFRRRQVRSKVRSAFSRIPSHFRPVALGTADTWSSQLPLT